MKKTILEWFEEAKANGAEWADSAINTTIKLSGKKRLKSTCYSLEMALRGAFTWYASKDGYEHWEKIALSLKNA